MSSESKTWLVILAASVAALVGEGVTVAVFGYPISHAMADAPEIAGLLFAFFAGLLLAHWRWPAKARWLEQDRYIEQFGNPGKLRVRVGTVWDYAEGLWSIHRAKGPALKEKP